MVIFTSCLKFGQTNLETRLSLIPIFMEAPDYHHSQRVNPECVEETFLREHWTTDNFANVKDSVLETNLEREALNQVVSASTIHQTKMKQSSDS